MKKRKELNALIGLGDSKRKKTKKGSGHRLLRTEPPGSESESSTDDDEFNSMNNETSFGKRNYTQCCNICYPLFLFIILAACVMACAGLIWMQIALKEDLDLLKEKMQTMDSSQKVSSHEISKLNEDLKTKQKKLDDVENGDKGLNKLWSNLTEINRKISLLDSAVNHLKANIKSASDLINLPTTVEELQKSVATIGSTLTSVQHDVNTMQASIENQKKYADELKTLDVTDLKETLSEANKTQELHQLWTDEQIHTLMSAIANLSQRMSAMEGSDQAAKYKALKDSEEAATTTKPVPDAEHDQASQLAESQPTGLPQFLPVTRSKRDSGTGCPMTVFLPGVSSLEDLEDLFEQKGLALNSLIMSYQDLRGIFGKLIPNAHIMKCFDKDEDQRYSFVELKAATGF